jgi:hypothetical protein
MYYDIPTKIQQQIESLKLDAYNGVIDINYAYSEIYRLEQLLTSLKEKKPIKIKDSK